MVTPTSICVSICVLYLEPFSVRQVEIIGAYGNTSIEIHAKYLNSKALPVALWSALDLQATVQRLLPYSATTTLKIVFFPPWPTQSVFILQASHIFCNFFLCLAICTSEDVLGHE